MPSTANPKAKQVTPPTPPSASRQIILNLIEKNKITRREVELFVEAKGIMSAAMLRKYMTRGTEMSTGKWDQVVYHLNHWPRS